MLGTPARNARLRPASAGLCVCLAAIALALVLAGPSQAAPTSFDRAWGKAVNLTTTGDLCTAASGNTCQAATAGGVGGQWNNPRGIAFDAAGNIYVVDSSNNRVQKFDPSGNFLRAWGKNVGGGGVFGGCLPATSCLAGTTGGLGGEMNTPVGIAVDSTGVYVADAGNNRIQKFSLGGAFLFTWGKGVAGGAGYEPCSVAASCSAGLAGAKGGEMSFPTGVSTCCESGEVYVADTGNHRVQRFNFQGGFNRAWGRSVNGGSAFGVCTAAASCLAGTTGGLGGEMSQPDGIATDAAGYVYVADSANNRIQRFGSGGTWDRAWGRSVNGGGAFGVCLAAPSCLAGTTGGLGGEMSFPSAVAADSSGHLYVVDSTNNRIQRFGTGGTWDRAWGKHVNGGGAFGVCTAAACCLPGTTGGLGGEMNFPFSAATDSGGNLYVSELLNQRIQKFVEPPPPTGQRAAALKKCKKKRGKKRKKCKRAANKLPL